MNTSVESERRFLEEKEWLNLLGGTKKEPECTPPSYRWVASYLKEKCLPFWPAYPLGLQMSWKILKVQDGFIVHLYVSGERESQKFSSQGEDLRECLDGLVLKLEQMVVRLPDYAGSLIDIEQVC